MEVIHDDAEIQVIHRPGRSDFTLVTFASLGARPEPGTFWGLEPAEALDLDCISFTPRDDNWFPAASMAVVAPLVHRIARPARVGYGYSMGGYGALKYGRLLGLTHALALSPQYSIDPLDAPEETRNHHWFRPELHRDMLVKAEDLAPWCAVVGDRWEDYEGRRLHYFTERLPAHPLPAPFMGHWTIWLAVGTAVLEAFLRGVLARDVAGLRRLVLAQCKASPVWRAMLGAAAVKHGRPALGRRLWDQALAAGAGHAQDLLDSSLAKGAGLRLDALLARGAADEALACARQLVRLWPDQPRLSEMLGHRLLEEGRPAEAEPWFRLALARGDAPPAAHSGLSLALARQGEFFAALPAAEAAAALQPESADAAAWCGHLLVALGRHAEALARFAQAVAAAPALAHAWQGRCAALEALGDAAGALEAARAGLRHAPGDSALRESLARLASPG